MPTHYSDFADTISPYNVLPALKEALDVFATFNGPSPGSQMSAAWGQNIEFMQCIRQDLILLNELAAKDEKDRAVQSNGTFPRQPDAVDRLGLAEDFQQFAERLRAIEGASELSNRIQQIVEVLKDEQKGKTLLHILHTDPEIHSVPLDFWQLAVAGASQNIKQRR